MRAGPMSDRRIAATLSLTLTLLAAHPAKADTFAQLWVKCRSDDAAAQIRACTALIDARRETPASLARVFFNRGRAFADRGEFARAIADFDQAVARDPDFPDAFNSRGIAFAASGQSAKAIEDFDRAIAQDGNHAIAIYNRGLALRALGRLEEAAQSFQKAKEVGPRLTVPKE